MSPKDPVFRQKAGAAPGALDRLLRVLLLACGVGVAGWFVWQAALVLRGGRTSAASPAAAENAAADASIAAAMRALDALAALDAREPAPPPEPRGTDHNYRNDRPTLSRQEARTSAGNVRRVAREAKEELAGLGLAETEDAGLVARDWLKGETAFSIGSWEAAEQDYYRIINRIRQLREVVRISRELDASERAVAAALAAEQKLLKKHGGERLREVVALAREARGLSASDPIRSAKLYQEALAKLPVAVGEARRTERREKIDALLQLARHAADRADWVAAATAAAAILKVEPKNERAEALRAQAVAGIDALADRYVRLQHEPHREAERKADTAQIRRGARDGDPVCRLAAALYGRTDPALAGTPEARERDRAAGWPGALRRAEEGMRGAAFLVARCYEEGFGVARDMPAALRWYLRSAEQGSVAAQNNLARLYHHGIEGVAQDTSEAARWYRRAAEAGSVPSQCTLAGLLLSDTNETAVAEAAAWYGQAATAGSPLAQCNLGLLLMTGRGVPRDEARAAALFRGAAGKGDALAQFNLGYLHMTGKGVKQDDTEAVVWYRQAADQGFAAAQRNLGGMYALGRGVPRDDAAAAAWYTRAAEQGDAGAQCNIGWMHAHGVGVAKDPARAAAWYRRSAEQGNAEALFMLGVMTVEGTGTARDEEQGRRWIAEAAARGLDQARAWLDLAERPTAAEAPEAPPPAEGMP